MATTNAYAPNFTEVVNSLNGLTEDNKYIKQVIIDKEPSSFCPYIQFVRLDALHKEDYPHHIDMNSVYITFTVNHMEKKVEVHSTGHVWLSEEDKKEDRYKYLAMKSMQMVYTDFGGKKFRKCKFKNAEDLKKKMLTYFNAVMESVERYTGGYPYKA